jgi:ATP-dependent DNA helicase RecG
MKIPREDMARKISALPFSLTAAQQRTLSEILADMEKPFPMNRLIQGDVGSGKTVVALLASLAAIVNGYQAAFMAPTEILAGQHYQTISTLTRAMDIRVVLLTGSQAKAERAEILQSIQSGSAHLVIGTHAIIQDAVEFSRLGFVVIDEQHKFGVMQRAQLKKKGVNPDVLVMTATPIPRTLGLTVYGDLDLSLIDELPPGRTAITTKVFHEKNREEVYAIVRAELARGSQTFIVYPLVEESEKMDLKDATNMARHLQQDIFPAYRVGLIHGKMAAAEKDAIMAEFQKGVIHILVATTVIEVGIDIPNASIMIIEHAERFGLSQLHQLRGRVGRGAAQSTCILLAQYRKSDDARRRLAIMEQTCDGFKIAEEDFNIRGPGEFLGTRQSGLPDFRVANILRDVKVLHEARRAAFELAARDPDLTAEEHRLIKKVLAELWKGRLELAGIG